MPAAVILVAPVPAAADSVFLELAAPLSTLRGDLPRHVTRDAVAGIDGGGFGLGLRRGDWAVEALITGHDLRTVHGGHEAHLWGIGPAVRRFVPLGEHVELTARVGVDRNALVGPVESPLVDYRGVGAHVSAGASLFVRVDDARIALTAEVFRRDLWLEGDGKDIDGSIRGVLIGLTLATDDRR